LPGTLADVRGEEAMVHLEGGGRAAARLADGSRQGDRVEVFLRPEVVAIGSGGEGATLDGVVDSLLFNGANSRVLVRAVNGRLVEVADPSAAPAVEKGDAVKLTWQPTRARVFARRKA